ncbi:hypothetical protein ACOSQ2_014397 [Xanthoceras sorbifolium]
MAHKQFETVKVERLNNVNFRVWKRRIKFLLTHEKTLHIVDKEKSKDADSKWEEDNALARATILNHMQDDLIPLYKGFNTAKRIMDMLEDKYGPKSKTYIQLFLEQFNGLRMSENESIVDHILKLEVIAKDLSNAGHEIPDKMQVSTLLNSLPELWNHLVTSLTYGQKDLSMMTLPTLLAIEEVRMNRRKTKSGNGNLLIAADSHKMQGKNFKKRKSQHKQNFKKKNGCFICGNIGHFKANCPKRKKTNDKQKEIVLIVSEALIAKSDNQWWIDSGVTRHVCKDKSCFFNIKDKAPEEHRLYMGNNTYVDVLGKGNCKIAFDNFTIILQNVLYAPSIRRNLIFVYVLEKRNFEIRFKPRFVGNFDWTGLFPNAHVRHLDFWRSDHRPILLHLDSSTDVPRPIRKGPRMCTVVPLSK